MCYEFCIEQDLTDSDDSQYYLDEEEAKMMYSDWWMTIGTTETDYLSLPLH